MPLEFNIESPFEKMIIRYLNGQLSIEEIEKLNEWVEKSPENRKVFRTYQNIWLGSSESFPDEKRFNPHQAWKIVFDHIRHVPDRYKRSTFRHIYIGLTKIAALVAIFFTIGVVASYFVTSQYQNLAIEEGPYEISVPQGAKTKIVLPDSSIVWLNAGSKIIHASDFNQTERSVELQGEAYFEVNTNPDKPFIVKTAHLDVVATGTSFNVKAYPGEKTISATLVEGNVVIEIPYTNDRLLTYELEPNQNFTYDIVERRVANMDELNNKVPKEEMPAEIAMKEIGEVNKPKILLQNNIKPELFTSWKDDVWIIEGETLESMATMLSRRFNTEINIQTEELKTYRFTGKIKNETLEQVLDILQMTTPLKYSLGKGHVDWIIDPNHKEKFDILIKSDTI